MGVFTGVIKNKPSTRVSRRTWSIKRRKGKRGRSAGKQSGGSSVVSVGHSVDVIVLDRSNHSVVRFPTKNVPRRGQSRHSLKGQKDVPDRFQ